MVVKNPSDFVGAHLGQSESQTKAILANSVGKILIIDEVSGDAQNLEDGSSNSE